MPIVSEAQRGFLHANHPGIAKLWEEHTPPGKLPARACKTPGRKIRSRGRGRGLGIGRGYGPIGRRSPMASDLA